MSYDDRQAASILKKAAELQAASTGGETDSRLSIDDLKRIAAEAGIAPEMVEEASRQVGARGSGRDKVNVKRVLTVGRELGEREYEEIVGILRTEYGQAGTPSTLGSAFEWTAGDLVNLHMSMVPRDGKTTITVSQRRDGILVAWIISCIINFLGILLPLVILGKQGQILTGAMYALLITLFLVGTTTLATRAGAKQADRRLDGVMDRIAEAVAKAPAAPAIQAANLAERMASSEESAEVNQQA